MKRIDRLAKRADDVSRRLTNGSATIAGEYPAIAADMRDAAHAMMQLLNEVKG